MDSIRLGTSFITDGKSLESLFSMLGKQPRIVDEIAFFTSYYHVPLSLEALKAVAKNLGEAFPKGRALGYRVGLNHLATTGHHNENLAVCVDSSLQRQVGLDGKICEGALCMASPDVLRYVRQSYEILASSRPDFMWIDDDVRLGGHMPTKGCCLCDGCIADFSKVAGEVFTHASLVAALDDPDFKRRERIRRTFMERNSRVIGELLSLIEKTVHSVDPEIELGFMTTDRFWEGGGLKAWAEALRGKSDLPVRWRPGCGFYSDEQPVWLIGKAHSIGRQLADLPPYVEIIQSEIENFPYQSLRKSTQTNAIEMAAYILAGCSGSALNILNMEGNPLTESIPLLKRLEENIAFGNILKENLQGSVPVGIWPAWDPLELAAGAADGAKSLFGDMFNDMEKPYSLAELGLPVCYKQDHGYLSAFAGRMPHAFGKKRMEEFLSKGALLDADALLALEEMGLGHLTGVKLGKSYDWDTQECLTAHPLNSEFAGWKRDCRQSFRAWDVLAHELIPISPDAEILARIGDYCGNDYGASLTVHTNELGGRVAVMSYYPWTLNKGLAKRQQMLRLCDWLSNGKMPVAIETFARITPWVRLHPDGRMVIGLINLSGDTYDSIDISVRSANAKFKRLGMDGSVKPLSSIEDGGIQRISLKAFKPFSCEIVICQ